MANIQLLRNKTVYESEEAATLAINGQVANLPDGTPIIARYKVTSGLHQGFKTMLAIVNKISGETHVTKTILE